ncbi:MAG: redox-sensing transcriptional repressor Rex [Cetobacterium sp.]|uniref:Redox-sensing transcriptional repressor Rex n=1 Tax=Cetobacterium ceti TaxID=180163 RepID=A0A1T4JYB9_9FUSO|nr:redox-sensing transcriptional repressor Rex [Cetobacterium ceti]MCJ8342240.1 redox-sensing transcriptional repressor Rex [Cetobacterium sp.]SJZ35262.1 redox-sensing transcriptional repressor [Cetobacterium ceti]
MERNNKISKKIIERLTKYLKCLGNFSPDDYISSEEMGGLLGVTAAQIRKDFSNFIPAFQYNFGIRGKGYHVKSLTEALSQILGLHKENNLIIVGAGNLGGAILQEGGFIKDGFNIVGIFDIAKNKIGKEYRGIKVKSVYEIENLVKDTEVDIAVITECNPIAQEMADLVINSGIKSILNFTPMELKVPKNVAISHIDINSKLQELNYWKEKVKNI